MGSESAIYISPDDKFMTDMAYDGTNFLIVGHQILGDNEGPFPFALLVSPTGDMITMVSFDTSLPGEFPRVAFDGTNYLAAWTAHVTEDNSSILAQFVSTAGVLIGSPLTIIAAQGVHDIGDIAFAGTSYLVIWTDRRNENADIYGQLITQSGDLIGAEIPVCTAPYNQKDPAVATNGESYLVVWNDGRRLEQGHGEDIYGQMIAGTGSLSDPNFIISQNNYPSDNPIGIATDGTSYFVAWMEEVGGYESREWDIYGRLVTSSGTLAGNEVNIVEKAGGQYFPSLAFDGTNYLAVWTDMANDLNKNGYYDPGEGTGSDISGIFLDTSGNPVGSEFIISDVLNDQLGAGVCFRAEKYFVGWTDARAGTHGIYQGFSYGDIYGVMFHKTPTNVLDRESNPIAFSLYPNYPNPFNPCTTITYHVPVSGHVRIAVCNATGQKIATLVDGYVERGKHSVVWDGNPFPSGVYCYILETHGQIATRKMMLLK